MQRNFLSRLLLCLAPTVLAGLFVLSAARKEADGQTGFRLGTDLAGGTTLIYEVNLEKTLARQQRGLTPEQAQQQAAQGAGLSTDDIRRLAENLKRRIDPADLKNVVVRPIGNSRVEIILPFAGSTSGGKQGANEEFVREVRSLVAQTGVLEFRILANPVDDEPGMRDAENLLKLADTDAKQRELLASRAKAGLAPPAPSQEYRVSINGTDEDKVTYEWTELGKEERASLGLSNAYAEAPPPKKKESDPEPTHYYPVLAAQRGKPVRVGNMLLFSRDFVKANAGEAEQDKKVEYFVLTRLSPSDAVRVDRDMGLTATVGETRSSDSAVNFAFNATGAARFGKITERNKPSGNARRQLAVVMDDKVVSAPNLQAVITDRGQITGNFSIADINRLVYILRSGALSAELKPEPVSENTVGPTLGQDTIRKGLLAIGLSFAAVMLFMVYYYKFAGFVACVALLVNLLLTVGFMIAVNAAFTLPGLAGIVLMLGMAVDANVLIYERMREERDKGANLVTAIRLGYERALPTIIDTHLTSIFTAVVLYAFGNDNLKGFAVALTLGLIISLFTALSMTRLMFDYAVHKRFMTAFTPRSLFARPNIDFMRVRMPVFVATAALTVLGLVLFLARGEKALNIDFVGGTAYGGRLSEPRALATSGGKLGLLDLLGENRQAERLKLADADGVIWLGKPGTEEEGRTRPADWIYKLKYADGGEAVVTLANAPAGATEEEQLANVRARAQVLPEPSVELLRIAALGDNDLPAGETKSFTVRTIEKERDLVQVALDRLLRDENGQPLLQTTTVTKTEINGPVATLTLSAPTSPSYFKEFFVRELKLVNRFPTVGNSPAAEVVGVGEEAGRSGRFTQIRVDVSNNPEFKPLADAGKPGADAKKAAADGAAFAGALKAAEGAFSARPLPERVENFDAALASDTRNKALYAVLASWMAILGYLWFRFGSWTFGLAAVACLIHDLCFTLGVIAVAHYAHGTPIGTVLQLHDFKIDLPAVAALLTLVGYSVNDTIVVFDRIKEVRGKNPLLTPKMINDSVNQTLSRTVLASLTVFLVVGVLYWFGGEGVHLFSFVMVVGVIVGTFSSIYVASPMLLMLGEGVPKADERARPGAPVAAGAAK